jgi:FdhE protein
MTPELWLEAHSYLRPLADLSAQVAHAAARIDVLDARMPDWENYRPDFLAGMPLLPSADAAIDLEPGGRMTEALLERLASETSSGKLTAEICALDTELRREPRVSRRIADFLLGDDTLRSSFPGLLRYLAWTATARFLRPLVNTFDNRRDDERWSRKYCPTCGSLPAMGQLVGHRARAQASAFEGEKYLRIEYCQSCRAYLKTHDGVGGEPLFLADWTSLHLDIMARDRGLKRLAASLYEL